MSVTIMRRIAYIGSVKNEQVDVKTIVMAESEDEARSKVIEKFKSGLGDAFKEDEVEITLFADNYK